MKWSAYDSREIYIYVCISPMLSGNPSFTHADMITQDSKRKGYDKVNPALTPLVSRAVAAISAGGPNVSQYPISTYFLGRGF